MSTWLRRSRAALATGVTWAITWAIGGILIGVSSVLFPSLPWWDAFFAFFDAPLPMLAIPGFVGGLLFSGVLRVAGRRHRFHDLSLPRFAAWGALGGLLVALVPAALVGLGLATLAEGLGVGALVLALAGPLMLFSAVSAAGSLALARKGEDGMLEGGEEMRSLEP